MTTSIEHFERVQDKLGNSILNLVLVTLLVVALLAASFRPVICREALDASEHGWLIKQRHRVYGFVDAFVENQGVKVVSKKGGFSWSCCAPDWDAMLYNEERKIVCKVPYSSWSVNGIRTALSVTSNEGLCRRSRVLAGKKVYAGADSRVYRLLGLRNSGEIQDTRDAEYILSDRIKVQKNVELFLQALYDAPPANGIPLRLAKWDVAHKFGFGLDYNKHPEDVDILDTIIVKRLTKDVPVQPPGLKSYKSVPESEVLVKKGALDDVLILMGDGSKKGEREKNSEASKRDK